jgi:hypothetical protein
VAHVEMAGTLASSKGVSDATSVDAPGVQMNSFES